MLVASATIFKENEKFEMPDKREFYDQNFFCNCTSNENTVTRLSQVTVSVLVAEGGFEPPTFGL